MQDFELCLDYLICDPLRKNNLLYCLLRIDHTSAEEGGLSHSARAQAGIRHGPIGRTG